MKREDVDPYAAPTKPRTSRLPRVLLVDRMSAERKFAFVMLAFSGGLVFIWLLANAIYWWVDVGRQVIFRVLGR
jgi:hypothetical protein